MSVLIFAETTVNPDKPDALTAYMATTSPLLEKVGATIVQRYEVVEHVMGDTPAKFITIVRYPSREAVDQLFKCPQYKSLDKIKEEAFLHYRISIVRE